MGLRYFTFFFSVEASIEQHGIIKSQKTNWRHSCKERAFVGWAADLGIWVARMKNVKNLFCWVQQLILLLLLTLFMSFLRSMTDETTLADMRQMLVEEKDTIFCTLQRLLLVKWRNHFFLLKFQSSNAPNKSLRLFNFSFFLWAQTRYWTLLLIP